MIRKITHQKIWEFQKKTLNLQHEQYSIIRDFLLSEEDKKAYKKWENEQLNNSKLNKDLTNI